MWRVCSQLYDADVYLFLCQVNVVVTFVMLCRIWRHSGVLYWTCRPLYVKNNKYAVSSSTAFRCYRLYFYTTLSPMLCNRLPVSTLLPILLCCIFRQHCTHWVHTCRLLLPMSIQWTVCVWVCVCLWSRDPSKNGWTNQGAIGGGADSRGPKMGYNVGATWPIRVNDPCSGRCVMSLPLL